jgi:hypothetical protein
MTTADLSSADQALLDKLNVAVAAASGAAGVLRIAKS